MRRRCAGFIAGMMLMIVLFIQAIALPGAVKRYTARDLKVDFRTDESAMFSVPVSISHDQDSIYVVDAEEHTINVFSKSGSFRRSFGRKGQGPGEFDRPNSLDIIGDKLYVSDAFNQRIQILDKKGKWLGGFKVPFFPEQICVLPGEQIVVSHLPVGIDESERMVHGYSKDGDLLWEDVKCFFSGDMIYDSFRNRVVLIEGGGGDLFVVYKNDERAILRLGRDGKSMPGIRVTGDYAFKKITLPIKGRNKDLQGFCWNAVSGPDGPALLTTEFNEGKDLGPGHQIFLFDSRGNIQGIIDLPSKVKIIQIDDRKIYAIDTEARLRIFTWRP